MTWVYQRCCSSLRQLTQMFLGSEINNVPGGNIQIQFVESAFKPLHLLHDGNGSVINAEMSKNIPIIGMHNWVIRQIHCIDISKIVAVRRRDDDLLWLSCFPNSGEDDIFLQHVVISKGFVAGSKYMNSSET